MGIHQSAVPICKLDDHFKSLSSTNLQNASITMILFASNGILTCMCSRSVLSIHNCYFNILQEKT
ncbi:hypothetical protein T4D_1947 [Trichinella pseudospiralis]|uniref:Uncharacterized protein n=1 Tax=Trichinella pseudospiralis TaxID=6337 RepID=A0A0V1FQQ1_TRIPS|nr:hypothetical protein T4D_1947 [Trichinella pseudospiralis]